MKPSVNPCYWVGAFLCLTVIATAQEQDQPRLPTFFLALEEINGIRIAGNGMTRMTVSPGDRLTTKVLLKNWSPDGELAKGIQAELDHLTFFNGDSGSIKPAAYAATTLQGLSNDKHAYIDLRNLSFLHAGEQAVPFCDSDTVQPGYRWISVLIFGKGPISKQRGERKYIGTLDLEVSDDASGTFSVGFVVGGMNTAILVTPVLQVPNVQAEPLVLDVQPLGENRRWIRSSKPAFGSVDARSPKGKAVQPWQTVDLTFNADAAPLSPGDFQIADGTKSPPRIVSLDKRGRTAKLTFDRPVSANAWTTITHMASGVATRIGRLNGDVNGDGYCESADAGNFVDRINRRGTITNHRGDMDGDGVANALDLVSLLHLLVDGGAGELPYAE